VADDEWFRALDQELRAKLDCTGGGVRRRDLTNPRSAENKSGPLGLKPALILETLRGAEAPLFHGAARIREFFHDL
jgi:hypothetical protein